MNFYYSVEEVKDLKGINYLIAQDGLYIHNKNDIFESIAQLSNESIGFAELASLLSRYTPELCDRFKSCPSTYEKYFKVTKKITRNTMSTVVKWLQHQYEKNSSEAAAGLFVENGEYKIEIPSQTNGPSSVKYDPSSVQNNVVVWIHSHPGFGAYQSGGDQKDALEQPGIHITVGRVTSFKPEFDCVGSFRGLFKLSNDDVIESPESIIGTEIDFSEWDKKVSVSNAYRGYNCAQSDISSGYNVDNYKMWRGERGAEYESNAPFQHVPTKVRAWSSVQGKATPLPPKPLTKEDIEIKEYHVREINECLKGLTAEETVSVLEFITDDLAQIAYEERLEEIEAYEESLRQLDDMEDKDDVGHFEMNENDWAKI